MRLSESFIAPRLAGQAPSLRVAASSFHLHCLEITRLLSQVRCTGRDPPRGSTSTPPRNFTFLSPEQIQQSDSTLSSPTGHLTHLPSSLFSCFSWIKFSNFFSYSLYYLVFVHVHPYSTGTKATSFFCQYYGYGTKIPQLSGYYPRYMVSGVRI